MTRRLFAILAIVLAVVLVAVAALGIVTVRKPFPDREGTAQLTGLGADVTVLRDDHGIPQVYADSAEDLFMAQGYVHAQDRFFEMDFRRHVTAGRLAELVGEAALETDKFVRTMGWRQVAEQELPKLAPATRRYLEAYARGVNAYIGDREASALSLEYSVLALSGPEYEPEPWTPADSLAWLKAMAWDLRSNMSDEIDRVLATEKLSRAQVDTLYPGFPFRRHDPIVTQGNVVEGAFDQSSGQRRNADTDRAEDVPETTPAGDDETDEVALRGLLGSMQGVAEVAKGLPTLLGFGDGIGSNAWAVSGERSATGEPILANDPHLAPSMPGIWHQMGLHCREVTDACPFDVAGFTFSGMPGVVVGHNADIAWGITTMYPDVTDLYIEQIQGDRYLYDGRWHALATREETFEVAGGEPETITVRETQRGPILSDVDDTLAEVGERAGGGSTYGVSLQWTALTPGRTMDALFGIDKASDWASFRKAARLFAVPSQNLVYADTKGNIGYQAPGQVPIRKRGDGTWPVPGWDASYGWEGFIPYEELPTVLNPAEGYVVTANQQVIGRQYPNLLGTGQAAGYRSQRIIDLLQSSSKLSVDDMTTIQNDTTNGQATTLLPHLLEIDLGSGYYADGQELLRGWSDQKQDRDSAAAAYFSAVWRNLLARTFHDDLPQDVWPAGGERWFEVVRRLLNSPDSDWWDDRTTKSVRETRDDILRTAMRDARDEMTRRQSLDPDRWSWGNVHTLTLENQTLGTSGIALVEKLFNRGPYEVGGGSGIVNATGWDAAEGYEVIAVPSMRMVVDLSDLDKSRWINLTGVSGHAFHRNYTDQTELWADGKTLPWRYTEDAVEKAARDELRLTAELEQ
ncbi:MULTISPECIES: penicillin acylase family protein [Mumia]|uniref:penicillin acylase family protein n=1 Tax=Mumia TaxID=1546255 RepID=UPI00141F8B7D|nr:penicillin acylase family protein [Mumia sp. ZJ430]